MRSILSLFAFLLSTSAQAFLIDFNQPNGFTDNGSGVDVTNTIDQLFGGQTAGIDIGIPGIAQSGPIETIADNAGYRIGLRSGNNASQLGYSFFTGVNTCCTLFDLHGSLDIVSLDLNLPDVPSPDAMLPPKVRVTLFDNPGGSASVNGNGLVLHTALLLGQGSLDFALPVGLSQDGNVTVQFELLEGDYVSLDNFRGGILVADCFDEPCFPVPEPGTWLLLALGALALGQTRRRQGRKQA